MRIQVNGFAMRRKEKCILYFIAFAFFMICFGAFSYLPKHQGEDSLISRTYIKFIGKGADPIKSPGSVININTDRSKGIYSYYICVIYYRQGI